MTKQLSESVDRKNFKKMMMDPNAKPLSANSAQLVKKNVLPSRKWPG